MEAAACGVPVVASRVGGIPLVMQNGRNGTLLPPDDKEAWVNALKTFFSAPETAQRTSVLARSNMESRYSIDSTTRELVKLGIHYRCIRWGYNTGDNFHDEEKD